MRPELKLSLLLLVVILPGSVRASGIGDSVYANHHPRLLFTEPDLPALRAKVNDGGYDAAAYDTVRAWVETVYADMTPREFFAGQHIGLSDVPVLGLYAHIEADTAARHTGRRFTSWLADSTAVDDNAYDSSLRLRALAIGYDCFYGDAEPEERGRVVAEMEACVDTMLTGFWYWVWGERPFLSNFTPMIAGALGLAAIVLDGETDPARVDAALAMADDYIERWLTYQMDPDGSYKEGAMYAGWSMRHLVYYFAARARYDGHDWGADARVRAMEHWVAFSLLPVGAGEVNNINDAASRNYPYARHHAYFDYAQSAWGSGLSLWLWERLAGPYGGRDPARLKSPESTVLWGRDDLAPVHPSDVLPDHFLWRDRGLYYYRTGWPAVSASDDVVFSFYSGKFHGGHAQEDQNSFTLYGYGERFAMDHGFLRPPRETEAHNLTLIDGRGQHNAGGTIGTDGRIADHLLGGFADYIFGDATRAYTTHSDFNLPDVPYEGMDWSYGYDGGNPVEYAHRRFVVVHGGEVPPYVVLVEDIRKDDSAHTYEWRLHTDESHAVDLSANPITITGTTGRMDLHVISPPFEGLGRLLGHFDNGHDDPDATVIRLEHNAVAESFVLLFVPAPIDAPMPLVTLQAYPWGSVSRLEWTGGARHTLIVNRSGGAVTFPWEADHALTTDAAIAVLQGTDESFDRHILTGATTLAVDITPLVTIRDDKADVSLAGSDVYLGRPDADFRLYAPEATNVWYEDEAVAFTRDGDYIESTGEPVTPPPAGRVILGAYPSPFQTTTMLVARAAPGHAVTFTVYDALGRRVARITRANPDGIVRVTWPAGEADGDRVASGVYFVRAESGGSSATRKVVRVR